MRMLRYHRAACLNYGHCHMLVPLDLDLSDLPGWQPDNTGVGQAPVLVDSEKSRAGALALLQDMTPGGSETGPYNATAGELSNIGTAPEDWEGVGVEHAEVPSLIVLQHFWLWQALHSSGLAEEADAFIAEAWPFIAHNLYAMEYDPAYGVKFHGDETYTHGSLYSTYDRPESGQIGYPNGYIPTDFFSFDNTLLHWSAALAAAEMADDQHVAKKALQLAHGLERCLRSYHYERSWHGKGLAPAISPLTHQLWPYPFSNLSLAGNSLAVNYGNMSIKYRVCMERFVVCGRLARQYKYMKQALHEPESWQAAGEPLISWWTTPWCGFGTGHALGTWLNAARYNADKQSCSEIEAQMLATASPEGAWCEVLDPQGQPVNIYGRVNRIRPWESGINYVMLAAWLNEQDQLVLGEDGEARQRVLSQITDGFQRDKQYYDEVERWQDSPRYDPSWFGYYTAEEQGWTWTTPPDETQLLVITRDNHYQDLIKQDRRLAGLTDKQVCAWDAGLPFSVHDLDAALFNGPVGAGLRPALGRS